MFSLAGGGGILYYPCGSSHLHQSLFARMPAWGRPQTAHLILMLAKSVGCMFGQVILVYCPLRNQCQWLIHIRIGKNGEVKKKFLITKHMCFPPSVLRTLLRSIVCVDSSPGWLIKLPPPVIQILWGLVFLSSEVNGHVRIGVGVYN